MLLIIMMTTLMMIITMMMNMMTVKISFIITMAIKIADLNHGLS